MLNVFRKWLKIKDEKEEVEPINKQLAKTKKEICDNADETIKVLNKTNKILKKPSIINNFYLVMKE